MKQFRPIFNTPNHGERVINDGIIRQSRDNFNEEPYVTPRLFDDVLDKQTIINKAPTNNLQGETAYVMPRLFGDVLDKQKPVVNEQTPANPQGETAYKAPTLADVLTKKRR
jgi:hypothetical protein